MGLIIATVATLWFLLNAQKREERAQPVAGAGRNGFADVKIPTKKHKFTCTAPSALCRVHIKRAVGAVLYSMEWLGGIILPGTCQTMPPLFP